MPEIIRESRFQRPVKDKTLNTVMGKKRLTPTWKVVGSGYNKLKELDPTCRFATLHPILQRHFTENSKQIFPEKELRGLSPNSYIHVSVCNLYIPTIGLPILLKEKRWTDGGNI